MQNEPDTGDFLGLCTDDLIARLRYRGNVCISGLTAAGKTTHSHLLAGEFGLTHVSGSQIQFSFMGLSPLQPRDFWISNAAEQLWDREQFKRIDTELLRLEATAEGYIFDTSTMPWRHRRPALCIWLESSLESRVIKSIVSTRGTSKFAPDEYLEKIIKKDKATLELYKDLYGIDIGRDLTCFDIIMDISTLIKVPTLETSLYSIGTVHTFLRTAVGWYLTGDPKFMEQMERASISCAHLIKRNRLLDPCTH